MTEYRSKRDAQRLARECRDGDKLYTVYKLSTRLPVPKEMYSEWTVSKGSRWRVPMAGPSTSVEQLVYSHGPVYDRPPRGMHNIADPLPQVGEPIPGGSDGWRHLSRAEIAGLEKEVRRAREETRR